MEESPGEYYDIPVVAPTDHESTSNQAQDVHFVIPVKSPSVFQAKDAVRLQYLSSTVNREARHLEPEQGMQPPTTSRSQSASTGVQEATPRQPHPRMAQAYSPRVFTPRSSEYKPPYAARCNTPTRMVDNPNYAAQPITPRVPYNAVPTKTGDVRPRTPVTGHRSHMRPMSQPMVAHNHQTHWRSPAVPPAYDANLGAYRKQWAGSSSDAFQHSSSGQLRPHAGLFASRGGSLMPR